MEVCRESIGDSETIGRRRHRSGVGRPALEGAATVTTSELDALGGRDGWQVDGQAARVHYSGAGDRYSVEYYAPNSSVLYWQVPPDDAGETAVPVARSAVPRPLRERIREDLRAAGIDPDVERRTV